MQSMRKVTALWLAVALVGLPGPPLRADDSDIFVGANIQPNILIFLDSSGSMDDFIDQAATAAYDPATTYPRTLPLPNWVNTKVYYCPSNRDCENEPGYYALYRDSIAQVPNADVPPAASAAAARNALTTAGKWNGRIGGSTRQLRTGNYLKYHFSPVGGHEKKITVAKRVLKALIENTEGVRFGLAKFTGNGTLGPGGAAIVADVGSSTPTLTTALTGIAPSGWTPLKGALEDMGDYYKGTVTNHPSPIQYECQPSFVIMMSDGLQNGYGDLRDEATLRRTQDHALGFINTQNVLVHTIGFAIPPSEADAANDVLQTAAQNGGGQFYSTTSETQLEAALETVIRRITEATFAFATPVIPTTSATGSTRAYLAAFKSNPSRPAWDGYLTAYTRDANGLVRLLPNGTPDPAFRAWEAGEQLTLKAAASRTIKTVLGTTLQDFTTGNATLTAALLGVAAGERDKLIDFIRGVDTYDEDADGNVTEERAWKLGDIFHSTPALVTPPFAPSADASYLAFKTAQAGRTTVLIGGANDGMLHAFRESDGEELWAVIPPDLLGGLKTLTNPAADHPYYVDGSPLVADVQISGTWKTLVLVGERRGGKAYHALDITDPTAPLYLWSFTDAKLGETWSEPTLGKMPVNGVETFVAFVGGGYDTTQNNASGKAVFALNVATGAKLWEYANPGAVSDDRQYLNFSLPGNPTAVDLTLDGRIDGLYIGDVGGQLWKFGPADPALPADLATNWTGQRLFAAPLAGTNPPADGEYYPAQAIYAAPIPAYDPLGHLWVYFGTGDRNHPNNTTPPNRFYGLQDTGVPLTEADLVDVTSTNGTDDQGWFFRLGSDEKVLAAADVFNKVVFFSSFTPTSVSACGTGGGTAKLYAIQMGTGYAALDWAAAAAVLTTSSAAATRAKTIGTGIPSKPIVVLTEAGATITTSVITATTSQELPSNPAPPPTSMRRVLYWREAF